jgi:microsomal dipeptidase-like Zn-dependent dipeptidase
VGLGTDLDGGIDSRYGPIHDLVELKELPRRLRRHFSAQQSEGIMGANWLDFLGRSLPPPK